MKDQLTTKKTKVVYNKNKLINIIADDLGKNKSTVRDVYNLLEKKVEEILAEASPNTDVTIRLFEGITLNSVYVPEVVKVNNLTGKETTFISRIKPKANITRDYKEKLSSYLDND